MPASPPPGSRTPRAAPAAPGRPPAGARGRRRRAGPRPRRPGGLGTTPPRAGRPRPGRAVRCGGGRRRAPDHAGVGRRASPRPAPEGVAPARFRPRAQAGTTAKGSGADRRVGLVSSGTPPRPYVPPPEARQTRTVRDLAHVRSRLGAGAGGAYPGAVAASRMTTRTTPLDAPAPQQAGEDATHATLHRRQFVLGPAPIRPDG